MQMTKIGGGLGALNPDLRGGGVIKDANKMLFLFVGEYTW